MESILINWWAVVVGAASLHILGFIWYGPIFGKAYGSIMGMPPVSQMSPETNKEFKNKMWPVYILNLILALITSYALAYFLNLLGDMAVGGGVCIALAIFFGFMLPLIAGNSMWSGKPRALAWKLFWINFGYYLISFIVLAGILSAWR